MTLATIGAEGRAEHGRSRRRRRRDLDSDDDAALGEAAAPRRSARVLIAELFVDQQAPACVTGDIKEAVPKGSRQV